MSFRRVLVMFKMSSAITFSSGRRFKTSQLFNLQKLKFMEDYCCDCVTKYTLEMCVCELKLYASSTSSFARRKRWHLHSPIPNEQPFGFRKIGSQHEHLLLTLCKFNSDKFSLRELRSVSCSFRWECV